MYETWYKMTVMLESGLDLKPIITHRFDDDFEEAETAMSGNSGKSFWSGKCTARSRTTKKGTGGNPVGGLYKSAGDQSSQSARVQVGEGSPVLNLCANNYLGNNHPEVVKAAGMP